MTTTEGTHHASYDTVTLTIPANARVRDDRLAAALSSLRPGEHVTVVQGLPRTWGVARSL